MSSEILKNPYPYNNQIEIGQDTDFAGIRNVVLSAKLSDEHIESTSKWYIIRNPNDTIIACMGLEPRNDYVYIQSLAVEKSYRRQGLAKKLIQQAMVNDVKPGQTLIALTLFWNRTVYEKLGFTMMDAAPIKIKDDVGARPKHKHCMALGRFNL